MRSWLEVFGAKQSYQQVAEKGDRDGDKRDVFEHISDAFERLFEFKTRYLSRSQARKYRMAAAKSTIVATVKMASFTKERIGSACLGSAQGRIRKLLELREGEVRKQ